MITLKARPTVHNGGCGAARTVDKDCRWEAPWRSGWDASPGWPLPVDGHRVALRTPATRPHSVIG